MTIKVGDKLPEATFKVMKDGKPADLSVADLTAGKKVALVRRAGRVHADLLGRAPAGLQGEGGGVPRQGRGYALRAWR